jgi:hypothetical protein
VFNACYVANMEVFPAHILGMAFGICNTFARVSTIVAPYIAELKPEMISEVIFCAVVLLASVATVKVRFRQQKMKK